jgi:hypothetical protein
MVIPELNRWRWALFATVVIIFLGFVTFFLSLPLREIDKTQAARILVAWIVEGRSVPGFGEKYPDARHMPEMKRFFITCDFLPPEVPLSEDPRVQRISEKEEEAVFKKHRFNDTDYIIIKLKSEGPKEMVLEFSNTFGGLAAHGYRFEFRRKIWGLRASGQLLWVS